MNSQPSLVNFMMIDDDDDHAKLVARNLGKDRIGNSFIHFSDGIEALKYLRKQGEHADARLPDVILLDLKLPGMGGHEILSAIKADEHLAGIPVVILTTSNAEVDRCKAYNLHANSYLVKPVDLKSFQQMARDLGLYWGMWNQPGACRKST